MGQEERIIIIAVLILLVLVGTIITLFLVFNKRKNQLLEEKEEIEVKFKNELAKSQIEIREETLRNISWELHDNIGQLMTLAKINAHMVKDDPSKIDEVVDSVSEALREVRTLSKSINPEYIKNLKLEEAVKLELERYDRLDYIHTKINIKGTKCKIDPNIEIIIFRILQEFFVNTIKHSKADMLEVELNYGEEKLEIHSKDNGVGYDPKSTSKGLGLQNMKNRAALIGANLSINSIKNNGTTLELNYSY